jgi:dipeptidyl aminopeptidase/acylaminoacyl peptidase
MLGVTNPRNGFEGNGGNMEYSSRVQAVVAMAGLVEAVSFYRETNVPARVAWLLGGTPEEVPQQYVAASPLTYVDGTHPPVLFMQGQFDNSCPLKQAQLLESKMKEVGGDFTLILKKSGSHEPYWGEPAVWKFLDDHLKQPTP